MEVDEREATEDTRSITSHPTEIARSHTREEPLTLSFMDRVRTRANSPALALTAGSSNRIQRIEQILGRFDPTLVTSRDAQHLAMSSLSAGALQMRSEEHTSELQSP